LIPNVRRTWAPRGQTPIVRHRYQRDKVSAISALTVSPQRHRCGLYVHFHFVNISRVEVAIFLRGLLRHVRGRLIVLWDGNTIHAGPEVEAVLSRHPRLQVERLPTYAPELNPDELVWNHLKARLANASFDTGDMLLDALTQVTRELRGAPALLRACVLASELPPPFSP